CHGPLRPLLWCGAAGFIGSRHSCKWIACERLHQSISHGLTLRHCRVAVMLACAGGCAGRLPIPTLTQHRHGGTVRLSTVGAHTCVGYGMTTGKSSASKKPFEGVAAELVVRHVRALIEGGALGPGDRLPPERELAVQVGVSRPSVRAGLRALAAMGVV